MKLSQREKILLAVLGILAIIWLYYAFVFTPQLEALQETEEKLSVLQKKVEDIELYNDPNGIMEQKYQETEKNIAAATAKYFPEILQERQIRIVDQMLTAASLKGDIMAFSKITSSPVLEKSGKKPEKGKLPDGKTFLFQNLKDQISPNRDEQTEEIEFSGNGVVEKLETLVEFKGTYPQLINFIKAIETYPRKTIISNVNISSGKGSGSAEVPVGLGELAGTINIQFYGIPKMHPEQDQDYTTWDIYDVYGRANPYLP